MAAASRTPYASDLEHDVVVVGARCAGAATAMLLARQGLDVAVVDRATFPSDTLSTHAISRGGVVQLARWGLLNQVIESGAPEIRRVTFRPGDGTELTRTVKDRSGVDHLLAPRRHALDMILVQAARRAGASVHTGGSVTGTLTDPGGRVVGVRVRDSEGNTREIRARFVVGADGVRSRVARSVGAAIIEERPAEGAAHYAYVAGLDAEGFEFHTGQRSFAGVFPTHGGEANVWICSPAQDAQLRGDDRATAFLRLLAGTSPSLAARVRSARVTSKVRSAVRFPNHIRQATGPGWALVGDAGYHRDPITGHGITDAFRDAELLARQLGAAFRGDRTEAAAMAAYAHERYRALSPIFEITCRLAEYPALDEFVALQKQLGDAIESEAAWLAALPPLPTPDRLVAA
jgi:2-polyprenyl-6-methoxyphenol hydroxylase-like FAD-dependent oxidoreductase